ncbi:hypothetical protein PP7435_CHR1-1073 [Komagataella phaffii CBS 7435]|uniref:MPN domain-containing protein n=2 Tax=Komagataella phaffii TaxID=460519 RepID=C4QY04_KOMPG|nr:Hypothetical protein PAS_chr1-4_0289 [Komagataella phaffii GS115]AOA61414.1 GQ67_01885T0 [Komagataella phaffii]CAH2446947.1 hypothetical protein BQ9382_C1-5645 [Komagataella phaffii CBS 7435]AOA66612.1 GQ68_01900T0 [Komagataella phaffii GS115]CAY68127.1 Hypothetical protein PAS_chr1-4_0289 [Komagataella phaffii GS115]CCA37203.1 hypothetical protein PP7435_CHR1-1073 [Komagataella phaffii CBS 7435]
MVASLHIVNPNLASAFSLPPRSNTLSVSIHASALLQILESSYFDQNKNGRIIGTLLGSRSEETTEVQVKDSFIVSHTEDGDEFTIDSSQREFVAIHKKSSPRDSVVGWFSINSKVDSFIGLVHDFFSKGPDSTHPYPAIYLSIQLCDESGSFVEPVFKAYVASPVGCYGALASHLDLEKAGSFVFSEVPTKVIYSANEKSLLAHFKNNVVEPKVPIPQNDTNQLISQLNKLDVSIDQLIDYVDKVISGSLDRNDVKNDEIGRFLLTNLVSLPTSPSKEELSSSISSHIQDSLMIDYLASAVKTQLDVSSKLMNLVQDDK